MSRPWVSHYDKGVPEHLTYPDQPAFAFLEQAAQKYPNHTALIFIGKEITYKQLDEWVNRCANALIALGVNKGDRVALLMPNCPQFVIAYYGALKAGAIVTAINPLYVEREVEWLLNDAGAETIIVFSRRYPLIRSVRPKTKLKNVIVTNIKDFFPPFTKLLYTLAKEKHEGDRQTLEAGDHDFLTLLKGYPAAKPAVDVKSSDIALFQYTGGTTGTPKGAMASHFNLVANSIQMKHWLNTPEATETFVGAIPFFHVYGMVAVMSAAITTASRIILLPNPRDIPAILKAIQQYKATLFHSVPTMYIGINTNPQTPKYNLRSIKACISGAAPLPLEVKQRFEEITGGKLCEGYGLSEAPTATHCNPLLGVNKAGSIGLPFPDVDCKIVDVETGTQELQTGEIGELCIRGPQVFQGYWNRPQETAMTLREGWLYTGDIARMDEDGYFYIVDRKKDMINVGGYKVYPRDVEEVLYAHPKVQEAAVVGIKDPYRGETVKAFVVLKAGQTATEDEIIAYCREHLARYKVPTSIEFRDSLPKTLVGKVLRRMLAEGVAAKD